MFAQYIPTWPVQDVCEEAVWLPGKRVNKWWQGQDILEFLGARVVVEAAAAGETEGAEG